MKAATLTSVLFTNLDYVCVNGVRANTHALVLSADTGLWLGEAPRHRINGYGSSCAWPVFDIFVSSIEYTIRSASNPNFVMLRDDGAVQPIMSGAIVQITDGPELQLIVHDYDKPIDVETFTVELAEDDSDSLSAFHQKVSTAVIDKVCAACRTPAMGGAVYLPPTQMRELLYKFR